MNFIKSIVIAFSMFSAIPVPCFNWDKDNMRYMMCGFTFVGVVTGIILFVHIYLSNIYYPLHYMARALICVVIPVIISGGIHLDGFSDTCDALASHASIEKKHEILKDSHTGSFAVIALILYFMTYFTCVYELLEAITNDNFFTVNVFYSSAFFTSRLLSAFEVASFKCAKNTGLVKSFSDYSAKVFTRIFCVVFLLLLSLCLLFICPLLAFVYLSAQFVFTAFYYFYIKKQFGGITGDTQGYFVQLSELVSVIAICITVRFL